MVKIAETQKLNSRQGIPQDTATDSKTIHNTNLMTLIKPFLYSKNSYKNFPNFFKVRHLEWKLFSIYTFICILKIQRERESTVPQMAQKVF